MFVGFAPPESNFFRMPNCWTDITAGINNLAELKIVEYVLRHTWGYQEFGILKTISVDEFMHGRKLKDGGRMDMGTGLSEQSVRNGIEKAIADGFLICHVDDRDKGRIKKSYALKMLEVKDLDPQTLDPKDRGINGRSQGSKSLTSTPQTLDPGVLNVRPRSEKETLERNSRKKERDAPPTNEQPKDVSLSLSLKKSSEEEVFISAQQSGSTNATLASLTEEETAFWNRWCGVAKAYPESLNQTGYKYVKFFAEKGLTTEEVRSLYDKSYERICEYAKAGGREPLPPRLGNAYKAYPDWEKTRERREQDRAEEQKSHDHIPGSGSMRNFTTERLAGNVQPLNYAPLPPQKRNRDTLTPIDPVSFTDKLAELRKRVKGSDNGDAPA